jgi:hypothetical protein
LISSLLESAKDTIKEKSLLIHEIAKEKMKWRKLDCGHL